MANLFNPRLVQLFGNAFTPGSLVFPITFLLSDVITEVYGYKFARRAIWTAFFFNFVFIAYGQMITHLPSPDFAKHNEVFDLFLNVSLRITIASFLSYLISEPLNSIVVSKLKVLSKGRWMSIRFLSSTFVSALVDTAIFCYYRFLWHYSKCQFSVYHYGCVCCKNDC